MDNTIKAVIYARYSSSGQREESIEGQLRECHEFAKRNNIIVVGEYTDKALTGKTDKRPDFQRMLRDSEKGLFNAVITWKIDRFARNRYDSAIYKYRLKKNNVRIFYAKESIPEGPEGIILESVMEGYAEYYSENLSQNVKRGNYESATERKTLGHIPYGYKTSSTGQYEIEPGAAAIVRRIFEEYESGKRMIDICKQLNSEGHRTPKGCLFSCSTCQRILKNKKYTGLYEYGDIYDPNGIPVIVDIMLFERVQKMMNVNSKAPSRKRGQDGFLLTTKLFCGKCGSPMTGDGGTSHTGKVYNYYTCNNRRVKKCDKERVKKDWIEDLVIDSLVNLIQDDEFIQCVSNHVAEYQNKTKDNSILTALETKKRETEKAIGNLLTAMEAGIITQSTKTRLITLESQIADIEKGILKEKTSSPIISKEQISYFLEGFRNGDKKDPAYRIRLIDTFLNSVYLYDDKLILILNYSGKNSKVTLPLIEKAVNGNGSTGSNLDSLGLPSMCTMHKKPAWYLPCGFCDSLLAYAIKKLKHKKVPKMICYVISS